MTLQTFFVEKGHGFLNGDFVRIVAGEAGESAAAFQETKTLAEIDRLVTNVPSIVPINGDALGGRWTMASAAEVIQLRSR